MNDKIKKTENLCECIACSCNIAKVQTTLCTALGLIVLQYGRMEYYMEEDFSMEWKKIASMAYGKIVFHSIPYHALPVQIPIQPSLPVQAALPVSIDMHGRPTI